MYGQQSLQDLVFMMLYGGVAMLAFIAAFYLLFRRANAFSPSIMPPKSLHRWTAAFFIAVALSHVWWYVLGVCWLTDDRLVRNITVIMLDHITLVPLVMGMLLCMLQDCRRPLWPWVLAQMPVMVAALMGISLHSEFYGYEMAHYWQLAVIIVFVVYYIHALMKYGRWLRENFADLEHKEVWQSLVFVVVLFVFYEVYTTNAGELTKEYMAQVVSIVIVAFLLWRVETLQRLEAVGETDADQSDYSYIGALLEQLCENSGLYLQHDLSLQQLASALGTNRTYLGAYFAQTGTTYNAYINLLRIEHFERLYIKALAISRPVTAQKLADESGFRSYSTFSAAFKKHRGITVSVWMEDVQTGMKVSESTKRVSESTKTDAGTTVCEGNHR
jgi:AraC-like DNA-binding protein